MKLSGPAAARFASAPDKSLAGALIWGDDESEVAARRDRLRRALIGDGEGADLRLVRLGAQEVRREPALLLDAIKARAFFAGRQVVTLEGATDGHAPAVAAALEAAEPDDAFLITTAGPLPPRSKLRALFEAARNAAAAPVYADTAGPEVIRALLAEAGLRDAEPGALAALETAAAGMDSGSFRDLARRLALFRLDEPGALRESDVIACGGDALSADLDALVDAVTLGPADALSPKLRRIQSQGEDAVRVLLAVARRFRELHGAQTGGVGGGGRPLFGAAREARDRSLRRWTTPEIEMALRHCLETDLTLRGPAGAAPYAILERALMRLALLPKGR